jgi:hypothetical protein
MRDLPKGQSENALQARTVHGKEYLIFLKTPSFVLCSLGMTCMTFAMGGIAMWMPYYLEHRPGALTATRLQCSAACCWLRDCSELC